MWFVWFVINLVTVRSMNDGSGDCSFTASQGSVGTCNYTLEHTEQSVYSWTPGTGSTSYWIGGPKIDASNLHNGGYVFFETSTLTVNPIPGFQTKAWLTSPVRPLTSPQGNCLRFSYNVQGLSACKLRVLRVQLIPISTGRSSQPNRQHPPGNSSGATNSILLPSSSSSLPWPGTRDLWNDPGPQHPKLFNGTGLREVIDLVWLSSDSTNGEWHSGHVTFSSPYRHAFIFEALPNAGRLQFTGHVAVDDIHFTDGPCDFECEFNSDFCQWRNVGSSADSDRAERQSNLTRQDDFDWSLSRGSLWTHTGPVRDQTSSTNQFNFGGYAFIDSRAANHAGYRAQLMSPILDATHAGDSKNQPLCLLFWVHMFGPGIGQLRLLQDKLANGSGRMEEIWQMSKSGPREVWFQAQVTVTSDESFQLIFEAVTGHAGHGDIAIDSLRFRNGSCPGLPETASKSKLDCTFEDGLCSWFVTNGRPNMAPLWSRVSPDLVPGLPEGHIQQNVLSPSSSHYLIFDTYQNGERSPGVRGYVSSPWLTSFNQSRCLTFWVHQSSLSTNHASRLGALELVLYEPNVTSFNDSKNQTIKYDSMISTTLWRLENHHDDQWIPAQVSFTARNGGFISFTGIPGQGIRGIVAIDDTVLHNGYCPPLPIEAQVSVIDCSFDVHLCGWSVDSMPFNQLIDSNNTLDSAEQNDTQIPTSTPVATTDSTESKFIEDTTDQFQTTTDGFTASITQVPSVATPTPSSGESVKTSRYDQDLAKTDARDFDSVVSYGVNTIEVLSTFRDGGSKSIIISRPSSRIARSTRRNQRIVSSPRIFDSSWSQDGVWRSPTPIGAWRWPSTQYRNNDDISSVLTNPPSPSRIELPGALLRGRFTLNSSVVVDDLGRAGPHVIPALNSPRWRLADKDASFNTLRDHTFQIASGGYLYFNHKGEAGPVNVTISRLHSHPFNTSKPSCFTFYFYIPPTSLNATLTIYSQKLNSTKAATKLWQLDSHLLRSMKLNDPLIPWIPAQIPIPGADMQTIIVEGSLRGGGMALDDVRLKLRQCRVQPEEAMVTQ